MSLVARALRSMNHSALWRHAVSVGADRLYAPSLDRLIYLWMHKLRHSRNVDLAFLRERLRSGMHVVDVGANIGIHSHVFARAVGPSGKVTAFEPDPLLFGAMVSSIKANNLRNISIHQLALGDQSGCGRLKRGLFNSGDNRLSANALPTSADDSVEARIVTLDDVLDGEPVDFIKIDVQGAEVNVLRGMKQIVEANPRLQLFVELWPYGLRAMGSSAEELLALMADYGFTAEIQRRRSRSVAIDFRVVSEREFWYTDIYAFRP
jgi:FkbM family methyltransferase